MEMRGANFVLLESQNPSVRLKRFAFQGHVLRNRQDLYSEVSPTGFNGAYFLVAVFQGTTFTSPHCVASALSQAPARTGTEAGLGLLGSDSQNEGAGCVRCRMDTGPLRDQPQRPR